MIKKALQTFCQLSSSKKTPVNRVNSDILNRHICRVVIILVSRAPVLYVLIRLQSIRYQSFRHIINVDNVYLHYEKYFEN